jgi:hypothetical protein
LGLTTRATNNPKKDAVDDLWAKMYPDDDIADIQANRSGTMQEERTTGAAAGRINMAANSLDKALPLLETAIKGVNLTDYPDLNSLENAVRKRTGDPKIVALNTAIQTVISDYSSLIARNGLSTDATRSAARELVNENMASGQLGAFIDQVRKEKDAQLLASSQAKKDITKKGGPTVHNFDDWK